jgi:aspartyl-tRNA synthetase
MERKYTSELKEMIGKNVTVAGWVHDCRILGGINFVLLRDRDGIVQVTAPKKEVSPEIIKTIEKLHQEDVLIVSGKVVKSKIAKIGIEIIPSELKMINKSSVPLPIDPREVTPSDLDTRMDWRYLDLRKPKNVLIFKIQTAMEKTMRDYWIKNGFIEIHSPKLMGSPSETGAELFEVKYFDGKAYLAQSPQFYKQMAMAAGFEKAFEIAPVFRANPSRTTRHDTEYTSIDMEMSWIDSHEDVMKFEERWFTHVIKEVKKQYGKEIKEVFGVDLIVPKIPFPCISLKECKTILEKAGKKVSYDEDLSPEEERAIGKFVKDKFNSEFVFVTEFPWKIKPFYHMRSEKNPSVTKGFDLLWKGLEITTGSQREHRYEILTSQAKEKGLNVENVKFYLDFFKYGCPPHGGFGFGLTRALMVMLNVENVREVTFAFRDMCRLFP